MSSIPPERVRQKMLALCAIAGVKVVHTTAYGGEWTLSVSRKPAIFLRNSAGYKYWKQAVKSLVAA